MNFETITYQTYDGIARIAHNRPNARNAQSQQLLEELDKALASATRDASVSVIVIGGHGGHFSAGHDLKEAAAKRSNLTPEQRWEFEERVYLGYALNIFDCPKPTIAEVDGACIAAGFMIANMCDLIVASDAAFFADPVCHSLGAAAVEVLVHPWVMGARQAKAFLFCGETITAADALSVGMVNKVVPVAALREETDSLARRISRADPFALKLVKRSINRTLDVQGMRSALNAHFDTHQLSHLSAGFQKRREEGLAKAIKRDETRS